ncbi:hypothetical protein D3C78_907690 [compost metagenome]
MLLTVVFRGEMSLLLEGAAEVRRMLEANLVANVCNRLIAINQLDFGLVYSSLHKKLEDGSTGYLFEGFRQIIFA